MSTTFTTRSTDGFSGEEWPDAWEEIVTLVEGDLADQIRAKTGIDGEVLIHERGDEGGWSEYSVEWDWTFRVTVGGTEVWTADDSSQSDFDDRASLTGERYNALGRFVEWSSKETA